MAPFRSSVSLEHVFALFLGVFLILLAILLHKRRDPMGYIPGPLLARWTPLWLAYHARRGRRFKAVHEAHKVGYDAS